MEIDLTQDDIENILLALKLAKKHDASHDYGSPYSKIAEHLKSNKHHYAKV